MNNLRTLLQDTDPVRHEASRLESERIRLRQAVLGATSVNGSAPSQRARLTVAAVLVAALGIAALGYQVWLHGPTTVLAAVRFEVRLAEDRPMPGLLVAQVAGSDRLVYLHPESVVSNDDIAQTSVSQSSADRFEVVVELLSAGAQRMRQATTTHLGRPLAIMIDGGVVMAPVVRSPIGDSAVISGNFTRAEAERIAKGIARN
jgi:SecDF, P1 head subdomain